MRVSPWLVPILVVGALLGTLLTAQAAGQWSVSGRGAVDAGSLRAEDLKGWMTLQQVMDGLNISQVELYALGGLPAEVPPATALKDLEGLVPGFEVSALREALAAWAAGAPGEPAQALPATVIATDLPPAAATTAPLPTPTTAPVVHSGAGAGAGAGPTPLPAGQLLPASQIKGRMSLAEISAQCAVPLAGLLERLGLPADTSANTQVKDLISAGQAADLEAVRAAVTALQTPAPGVE